MNAIYAKLAGMFMVVLGAVFLTHKYDAGQQALRDEANAKQYVAAIAKANEQRLAAEDKGRTDLALAQAAYQQELEKTNHEADARIAAVQSGARKLYIDANAAACASAVSNNPQSGSGPSFTTAIELPAAVGAGVESVGKECDQLADAYRTAYNRLKRLSTGEKHAPQ